MALTFDLLAWRVLTNAQNRRSLNLYEVLLPEHRVCLKFTWCYTMVVVCSINSIHIIYLLASLQPGTIK